MVKLTSILNWNGYHNIPKKYIYRRMFKGVVYENVHQITPTIVYNYTKDWIYTENAPWTSAAIEENDPKKFKPPVFVPPIKDFTFFRGDKVQILTGKDAGKQGVIFGVIRQRNWVLVKGLNMKLVANQTTPNASQFTYTQVEKPLVVNRDVKVIDPIDLFTEEGVKVRISKRTGGVIPIPDAELKTVDYTRKSDYKAGPKDTSSSIVGDVTFKPVYSTFEQDLRKTYLIEEDKERAETYVY